MIDQLLARAPNQFRRGASVARRLIDGLRAGAVARAPGARCRQRAEQPGANRQLEPNTDRSMPPIIMIGLRRRKRKRIEWAAHLSLAP